MAVLPSSPQPLCWQRKPGGPGVIESQVWEAGLGCYWSIPYSCMGPGPYWVSKTPKLYRTPVRGNSVVEVAMGALVHQGGGNLVQGRWLMAQWLETSANEDESRGALSTDCFLSLSVDLHCLLLLSLPLASA